jgi:hypothetical protein
MTKFKWLSDLSRYLDTAREGLAPDILSWMARVEPSLEVILRTLLEVTEVAAKHLTEIPGRSPMSPERIMVESDPLTEGVSESLKVARSFPKTSSLTATGVLNFLILTLEAILREPDLNSSRRGPHAPWYGLEPHSSQIQLWLQLGELIGLSKSDIRGATELFKLLATRRTKSRVRGFAYRVREKRRRLK